MECWNVLTHNVLHVSIWSNLVKWEGSVERRRGIVVRVLIIIVHIIGCQQVSPSTDEHSGGGGGEGTGGEGQRDSSCLTLNVTSYILLSSHTAHSPTLYSLSTNVPSLSSHAPLAIFTCSSPLSSHLPHSFLTYPSLSSHVPPRSPPTSLTLFTHPSLSSHVPPCSPPTSLTLFSRTPRYPHMFLPALLPPPSLPPHAPLAIFTCSSPLSSHLPHSPLMHPLLSSHTPPPSLPPTSHTEVHPQRRTRIYPGHIVPLH